MSHLRKLSDRLGKILIASSRPILPLLPENTKKLEFASSRHPSISKTMKEYQIPCMLLTASQQGLASLSANQLGFDSSAFVLHKELEPDKWSGYKASVGDYQAYINPVVLGVGQDISSGFERCASLPNLFAQVERHERVKVEYLSMGGEYIEEEIRGFKARVFMHEYDHTLGFLLTSFCVSFGRIFADDPKKNTNLLEILEEFREKIAEEIEKYERKTEEANHECIDKETGTEKEKEAGDHHEYVRQLLGVEFETEFQEAIVLALEADTQDT